MYLVIYTYKKTGKQYSSYGPISHSRMDVYDNQVVDGQEQKQKEAKYMRPYVHSFVSPPEYAERNNLIYSTNLCFMLGFLSKVFNKIL